MLIAGGSLSAGSHDPHFGTSMPPGAVHPICGRAEIRGPPHDAAVRGQAAAIEGRGEFLPSDAWQRERQQGIFVHGGCGALRLVVTLGLDTQSVNAISILRDTRQRSPAMSVNKTG